MKLGQKLRVLRKDKNLSISDVAHAAGVDFSTCWRWEMGEFEPSFKARVRLAELFDVAVGTLQDDAEAA